MPKPPGTTHMHRMTIRTLYPVFIFLTLVVLLKKNLLQYAIGLEPVLAEHYGKILHNSAVILLSLGFIYRYRLAGVAGLGWAPLRDAPLLLYPLAIIALLGASNLDTIRSTDTSLLWVYLLAMFSVGLAEEFAFRGFVQSYLLAQTRSKSAVWMAAFLFGALHFINLLQEPDNLENIAKQVLIAVSLGLYFGALLLRTGNLLVVGLLHGLIDFVFGIYRLAPEPEAAATPETAGSSTFSLYYILVLLPLLSGLYLLRSVSVPNTPDNRDT